MAYRKHNEIDEYEEDVVDYGRDGEFDSDCHWDDYDYYDYMSSYNGDYSPSCPWNAPGMSIHDFI